MKKRLILLNPGPVNVTPGVRRALLGPDACHREPEFTALYARIRRKLLGLFKIERTHDVAIFTGSGTLAVEAMLVSYSAAGKKVLVLSNGVYGERMASILAAHRLPHVTLRSEFTTFPPLAEIERKLRSDSNLSAVALVHHETSTGALNPVSEVAALARCLKKTILVDAVSSLGAERLDPERLDFVAASSGKCLHAFPGLSFVFVKKSAVAALARSGAGIYTDVARTLDSQNRGEPPFTPAVQLCYAFERALDELSREGVSRRIASYARKSTLVQRGLERAGARFLLESSRRSHVLQACWLPPGLSYEHLHEAMKREGFVIYAGQSAFRDRIFRVSVLGAVSESDLKRFLSQFTRLAAGVAPRVILLAAGRGKRFGRRTTALPKCLIPLGGGDTLLKRYFDSFRELGLREITVVVGHEHGQVRRAAKRWGKGLNVRFVYNAQYKKGSVLSLRRARSHFDRSILVMDADVYFPTEALGRLLEAPAESAFLIDPRSRSAGEEMMVMARNGRLAEISKRVNPRLSVVGEATGIAKFGKGDARMLARILDGLHRAGRHDVEYEESFSRLMKRRDLGAVGMDGLFWTEMDFEEDLARIRAFRKA